MKLSDIAPNKPNDRNTIGLSGAGWFGGAAKSGAKIEDIPYILSNIPKAAGLPAIVSPTEIGAKIPERIFGVNRSVNPVTEAGRKLGDVVNTSTKAALLADTLGIAKPELNKISARNAFEKSTKNQRKFGKVAEEMKQSIYGKGGAKDVAYSDYGNYLGSKGSELVNEEGFNNIFNNLPKDVQEGMLQDVNLEKTSPNKAGATWIKPSLNNLKYIRSVMQGEVSPSYFNKGIYDAGKYINPEYLSRSELAGKTYEDIGGLMREGRPELASAMGKYAKYAKSAKPISKILNRPLTGTGTLSKQYQDLENLSEFSPSILNLYNKATGIEKGIQRGKMLKKAALFGAKAIGGLGAGGYLLHHLFGEQPEAYNY